MDNLPEELLCRILHNLQPRDVAQAALASTKFARIAQSVLYADCHMGGVETYDQPRMLQRLLRTLIENPDLAKLVHHINIGDWLIGDPHFPAEVEDPPDEDELTPLPLSQRQRHRFIRSASALADYSTEYQSDFWSDLRDTASDASTAAMLCLVPNLKSLSIFMSCCEWNEDFEDFRTIEVDFNRMLTLRLIEGPTKSSQVARSLFNNLSSVNLHGDLDPFMDRQGWDIQILSFFLKLPTMKTIVGYGCRDMYNPRPWLCDEGDSNVSFVQLQRCKMGAESIRKILRSCRALDTFKCIRMAKDTDHDDIPYDYSYGNIHHDLLRHDESLRCLHLHSKATTHLCPLNDEPIQYGCLKAFERLEELEVDEDVLFGRYEYAGRPLAQMLPPNIKHLAIMGELEATMRRPSQADLFKEMQKALLADHSLPHIEVPDGYNEHAEDFLKELPGVSIQKTPRRTRIYDVGSLVMSRLDE